MLAGVALLLVGLGFKVAAVPFHFWTPDVYQGAPTPVTAFMASAGKAAAFAAMLRVLLVALPNFSDDYRPVVWVLAVLTRRRRLGDGGRADQRQAHARVLVDQPRRLHARRRRGCGAHRRSARRNDGRSAVLLYLLHLRGARDRHVRVSSPPSAAPATAPPTSARSAASAAAAQCSRSR